MTERFHTALEANDGQAACEELSEETASKLEQQEGKPRASWEISAAGCPPTAPGRPYDCVLEG